MPDAALKESRNIRLDQSPRICDAKTFHPVMAWMNTSPSVAEAAGPPQRAHAKASLQNA
jgi:hypothetical protein